MAKRVQHSIGTNFVNGGVVREYVEEPYILDRSRQYYMFDIVPMGAPRMTQSDRWKVNPNHKDPQKRQREVVTRYFRYKDLLRHHAKDTNFEIGNVLDILFLIPMPNSWSKKKKDRMNGMPHKQKPDVDNLVKGFMDAMKKDDSDLWKTTSEKRWAYKGSIIIFG